MYKHILVPTDGSPLSMKAAKAAVSLAKALGARLTTLYAIPPYPPRPSSDRMFLRVEYFSPREYARQTRKHAAAALERVEAAARAAGVPCASMYLTGEEPWRLIVMTARSSKCDLIAMASHGRRRFAAILLGSETTKVLTHSRIPVLVCR